MSTARGGVRGRGRGSGGAPRGPSANRGTSFRGNNARGSTAPKTTFGQPSRGNNATRRARGASTAPATHGSRPPQQNKAGNAFGGGAQAKSNWKQRYEALTKFRERERRQAIAEGLIADPDQPRSLSEAITPVGTCQDMCAEYERAQRVEQNDVWREETDPNHSVYSTGRPEPVEARMVKKFRRAAAGLEEQLPSDLRPPSVLQRTCNYLFDEVVGNAPKLEKVHHFVWDRTRAIRNDFSIQQVTKVEDLRLAIDCYERIARFHIVSLHQLAVLPRPYDKYDAQQEREQLDRTLLSLMQYYDDSRGRLDLPNEAEFRAYCVIFQLQDPMPDLEDRAQSWPRHIVLDKRVQKALELYAAACNTMDSQGPLKPRANHIVAQQDWQRFWTLANSKEVSYLMGCVAEIYFNLVRRTALNALWRSFRQNPSKSPDDWTIDVLCDLFALDEEEQVVTFCEAYGFSFAERADGQQYLDLTSVKERVLPQPNVGLPKQWRSELVEGKRYGRILPAIINGLAVKQAEEAGMVVEEQDDEMELEDGVDLAQTHKHPFLEDSDELAQEDEDSLFIPEAKGQDDADIEASAMQPLANGFRAPSSGPAMTFGMASNGFGFGQPSSTTSTFGKPSGSQPTVGESLFTPKPFSATSAPATNGQPGSKLLSGASAPEAPTAAATLPSQPVQAVSLPKFEPSSFKFAKEPNGVSQNIQPSKFSFGLPSGDQNNISNGPAPNGDAAEKSPAGSFTFPTPSAPAELGQETENRSTINSSQAYKQPSIESAPTSPEKPFTFGEGQLAAGAMTSSQASVTRPETKPFQPQVTPSNPVQSTNIANGAHPPSSLGRKSSVGPYQVRRPSPLANSISSEDVNTLHATGETSGGASGKQPVKELFPARQDVGIHKTYTQSKAPEPPTDDLASIVARLAHEITTNEIAGFLNQYVEFAVQQAITSVQEKLHLEELISEADLFREAVLSRRYFKRWKDVFWGRKFAKRGSKRRERARRGLAELRRSQGSETSSVLGNTRAASTAGSIMDDVEAKRRMVDSMFQQAVRTGQRPGAMSAEQAKPGSKRPLSSHGADTSASVRDGGHKRMKSTSHIDDRGRITKPAPTSNPNADILKRSSFLGFSMPTGPPTATRSNYFRLKAMGIESGDSARGTKRRREESTEATPRTSPPSLRTEQAPSSPLRMSTLLQSSNERPRSDALMRPPSLAPATNDADEALFARLKAARESLAQGTNHLKDEVAKEEEFKRSLSASLSSNDSPSMVRARVEARWRASHTASTSGTAEAADNLPAYRLRESRFVPREQYGRAIERAKEVMETRSRESSRSESRAGHDALPAPKAPTVRQPQPDGSAFASQQSFHGIQSKPTKVPNGLPNSFLSQWQPPSVVQESQSFSQPPRPAGWTFANAVGLSSGFKSSAESPTNPFSSFASQPFQPVGGAQPRSSPPPEHHDFTIQPSQVQQSLSNSFGHAQPQGFGQPSVYGFEHHPSVPQEDSYMGAQDRSQHAFSLLSDDNEPPAYATHFAQQPEVNGNEHAEQYDELLDHAGEGEVQDSYQHSNDNNLYAVLADEMGGDTEEDVEEGRSIDDFQSQMGEEFEDDGEVANGYGHDGQEGGYAEEDLDGDVEDEEDYDDEGVEKDDETEDDPYLRRQAGFTNGDDLTEGEDEEDDIDGPSLRVWNQQPPKTDALQGVGGTVEEAIELSD